jgi:AcrR family transcriptional regulator
MPKGRKRTFDVDQAVASVLPIFMEKGFEGATFGELIAAMGINPPSFYIAFGSKEGLFRQVIELYASTGAALVAEALAKPTAYEAMEQLLRKTADAHTDPSRPPGCLFVQGALSCSSKATDIRTELEGRRSAIEPLLEARLYRAQSENDRSIHGDPVKIARYISTITQGLAVQAKGGSDRSTLQAIVDVTLEGLAVRRSASTDNENLSQLTRR